MCGKLKAAQMHQPECTHSHRKCCERQSNHAYTMKFTKWIDVFVWLQSIDKMIGMKK